MITLRNVISNVHLDEPITDPPGLDLSRAAILFDGELYEWDKLGEVLLRHALDGFSIRNLLRTYRKSKGALIASFVAPFKEAA